MNELDDIIQQITDLQYTVAQEIYTLAKAKAAKIDSEHTRPYPKKQGILADAIILQQASNGTWRIFVDETIAPHIKYVILGTSKMPARDFLTEAANEVKLKYNLKESYD